MAASARFKPAAHAPLDLALQSPYASAQAQARPASRQAPERRDPPVQSEPLLIPLAGPCRAGDLLQAPSYSRSGRQRQTSCGDSPLRPPTVARDATASRLEPRRCGDGSSNFAIVHMFTTLTTLREQRHGMTNP